MAQVINTNVASLFGQQALNKSNNDLQTAMQRLSSGMRINSAKDDPTGMVTAAGYDSTVRGANQAMRNANDGISQAQINDGFHAQVLENLQRLREIAVQGGGTASGNEANALVLENTRILGLASNTGNVVVNKDGGILAGTGTKATIVAGLTVGALDTAITAVTTARSTYGADMATFSSVVANLGVQSVNTAAAYSRVMDTDYAVETTNMTRNQILQQAGTAMLAQANQLPNSVLSLLK
ncbi:MAG: flagellin [Rhodocyclales bacterium]|nr:flagellin [Rhodocyclales bacterium]